MKLSLRQPLGKWLCQKVGLNIIKFKKKVIKQYVLISLELK